LSWLKTSPPHDPSVLNLDTVTPGLKIGVDTPQTFTYTSTDSNNKVSGTTTIPTPLPKTTKVTTEKSFHIRTMSWRARAPRFPRILLCAFAVGNFIIEIPHQTQHQLMSLLDDDVGGGPCHIDRSPAGLVSSRPLAPQGRSVLSDSVSPISAIPPRGATQVESQRYSFGYPPGRCPGLVKCYRGRHGRDAIRIEHHHGRTRGFRFPFSFLRRVRGSASVEPVRIWPSFTWSTATGQPSYQSLPSHTVSPRRSLRDLDTVANSAAWLGVPTERLQLFALEAWGVDDDGGTDAPTHLQVTPLKGHSTPSFSPLAIIWVTTPYEEQAWG